jgi:hypothetical protein
VIRRTNRCAGRAYIGPMRNPWNCSALFAICLAAMSPLRAADSPPPVCGELAALANQGKLEALFAQQRALAPPAPAELAPWLDNEQEYFQYFGRFVVPGDSREAFAILTPGGSWRILTRQAEEIPRTLVDYKLLKDSNFLAPVRGYWLRDGTTVIV